MGCVVIFYAKKKMLNSTFCVGQIHYNYRFKKIHYNYMGKYSVLVPYMQLLFHLQFLLFVAQRVTRHDQLGCQLPHV